MNLNNKMNKKTGVFIGRFQPFHLGHLSVINRMEKDESIARILVGIGSAQEANSFTNPFSFREREAMIGQVLKARLKKPFKIFGVQDVNQPKLWLDLVKLAAKEPFDIIYTNNPEVEEIAKGAGIKVNRSELTLGITATNIRKAIAKGEDISDLVPKEILAQLRLFKNRTINPCVTADIIINYKNKGIVLIQRKKREGDSNSLKWALPGGHLNYGLETLEEAAARECKEETNLDISLTSQNQFRQYSSPSRDLRGHYVTSVFYQEVKEGKLKAGDDAVDIGVYSLETKLPPLAFDHEQIIIDYKNFINSNRRKND